MRDLFRILHVAGTVASMDKDPWRIQTPPEVTCGVPTLPPRLVELADLAASGGSWVLEPAERWVSLAADGTAARALALSDERRDRTDAGPPGRHRLYQELLPRTAVGPGTAAKLARTRELGLFVSATVTLRYGDAVGICSGCRAGV